MAVTKRDHGALCPVGSFIQGYCKDFKDWALKLGVSGQKKKGRRQLWDSKRVMKPCITQEVLPASGLLKRPKTAPLAPLVELAENQERQGKHGLAQLEAGLYFAQWYDSQQTTNAAKFTIFIV